MTLVNKIITSLIQQKVCILFCHLSDLRTKRDLAVILSDSNEHPSGPQLPKRRKCHMTYEIVYRQKCDTVPVTDDKRTEKKCSTSYDTVYERVCKTIDKETRCQQVPKMIPKKSCRDVPVQTDQRVRKHCRDFPEKVAKMKCD